MDKRDRKSPRMFDLIIFYLHSTRTSSLDFVCSISVAILRIVMGHRNARIALVASLISNILAQTPIDFQPGSLVNLGVTYPAININPVGSLLQSLDRRSTSWPEGEAIN
jgi:hypothetical protein